MSVVLLQSISEFRTPLVDVPAISFIYCSSDGRIWQRFGANLGKISFGETLDDWCTSFPELKVTTWKGGREDGRKNWLTPDPFELQMRFSTAVLRPRERYANDAKTDSPKWEKRILGRQGFQSSHSGSCVKREEIIFVQNFDLRGQQHTFPLYGAKSVLQHTEMRLILCKSS